jgi:hypothetical protein
MRSVTINALGVTKSARKGAIMIKSIGAARGTNRSSAAVAFESVADILERELQNMNKDWLA